MRVIDLFRDWDEDANGLIDKAEFFKGIVALGVDAKRDEANELFDIFDIDGGGTIEYRELNKLLRQRAKPKRSSLRRVTSELMPPGVSRSSLLSQLTVSQSQSTLPTKLLPLGQRSLAQSGRTQSLASVRSTLRDNPFAYTSTFAPGKLEISHVAQHWWKPLHGQTWRHTRQLPPLRRNLVRTAPISEYE